MPQDPSTFRADLAAGQAVEQAVGAWAIERGWTAHRSCGKVSGYDLLLQCTIEVKADRMAPSTGNVAVEFSYRGQPSGIMATSAVFWCIAVNDCGYIVRVDVLRRLAERFSAIPAGDGKRAVVRLVPLDELKRIAREIHLPGVSGASGVPSAAPNVEVASMEIPEIPKPTESSIQVGQIETRNDRSAVLRQTNLFEKECLNVHDH
jgi:hypothetical protein